MPPTRPTCSPSGMLAHVPLLLHPAPRRAAILGLGSGVTLGSALTHGLERAVVLEISPEVVEASHFFDHVNHRPLDDSRTAARRRRRPHPPAARATKRYDVIVSEPSNPWMAGIASLFTREFFEIAKATAGAGRRVLPVGAHLRHQRRRPAVDRRDVPVGVPRRHALAGRRSRRAAGGFHRTAQRSPGRHRSRLAAAGGRRGPRDGERPIAVGRVVVVHRGRRRAERLGGRRTPPDRQPRPAGVLRSAQCVRRRSVRQRPGASGPGGDGPRPTAVAAALAAASPTEWRDLADMLYRADSYAPATGPLRARSRARSPAIAKRSTVSSERRCRSAGPICAERAGQAGRRPAERRCEAGAVAATGLGRGLRGQRPHPARHGPEPARRTCPAVEQLASIFSDAGDAERLAPAVARLRARGAGSRSDALLLRHARLPAAAARHRDPGGRSDAGHRPAARARSECAGRRPGRCRATRPGASGVSSRRSRWTRAIRRRIQTSRHWRWKLATWARRDACLPKR